MSKLSTINCDGCGKEFQKETRYIKAGQKKRNGKNYCSSKCFGKFSAANNLSSEWNNSEQNKQHLKQYSNNRKDEYSSFRTLLKSCKTRTNKSGQAKGEFDLDLLYLKELWEKQNGKCAITKVDLKLESSYNKNYQASLDRIDSSKGYVKDNVRYISVSANWLKNNLDDNHVMEFIQICRMVVN
jgi:LPS O-antigen subunit length determinant protein (WzzB/FepE family)